MPRADLSNKQFGRLTALTFAYSKSSNAHWDCACECGKSVIVAACHLKSGHTTSCGCAHAEMMSARATHRESVTQANTKEYRAWQNMKRRCYDPANNRYYRYGARGIRVCDAWINSYETFLADVGRAPSPRHTIDRLNNDGNYEPRNVRWATYVEQAKNRGGRFAKKESS